MAKPSTGTAYATCGMANVSDNRAYTVYRGPREGRSGWWITVEGVEYFADPDLGLDEALDAVDAQIAGEQETRA